MVGENNKHSLESGNTSNPDQSSQSHLSPSGSMPNVVHPENNILPGAQVTPVAQPNGGWNPATQSFDLPLEEPEDGDTVSVPGVDAELTPLDAPDQTPQARTYGWAADTQTVDVGTAQRTKAEADNVQIPAKFAEYKPLINAKPEQGKAWVNLLEYFEQAKMSPAGVGRNFYTRREFLEAKKNKSITRSEAVRSKLTRTKSGKQKFYPSPYEFDLDYIRVNPVPDRGTKYTELWNPTKGVVSYGFAKLSATEQEARAKAQVALYKQQGHTTLNLKSTNSRAYNRAMSKAAEEAGMFVNLKVDDSWHTFSLRHGLRALLSQMKTAHAAAAAPKFDVTEEQFKRFVDTAKVTPTSSMARTDALLGAADDKSGKLDRALNDCAVIKFNSVDRNGQTFNRYALTTNWLSSVEMIEMNKNDSRTPQIEGAVKRTYDGILQDTGHDVTKLGATPSTAPSSQPQGKPATISTAQTQTTSTPAGKGMPSKWDIPMCN